MNATPSQETLGEALTAHLAQNGLPPDGGDSEPFAVVKLGHVPYPIPNTKARKRAVKIHDLNHLVSGYKTDRVGEFEISAWELSSGGCANYGAAWLLDLAGMLAGFFISPRRTVRAFLIGRTQMNLYSIPLDALLTMRVSDARERVLHPQHKSAQRLPAGAHLAALGVLAIPVTMAMGALWWIFTPLWMLSRYQLNQGGSTT